MARTALDFDIDVDVSPLLGQCTAPSLVDDHWYLLAHAPRPRLRAQADRLLHNALLAAQWQAVRGRILDRRRAVRAPLLSRVDSDAGHHYIASDVSLSGLRCSGQPANAPVDIAFRLPGLGFPVEARAEVVSVQPGLAAASLGMRFTHIERPYVEWIAQYIDQQRRAVPVVQRRT